MVATLLLSVNFIRFLRVQNRHYSRADRMDIMPLHEDLQSVEVMTPVVIQRPNRQLFL